MSNSTLDLPNSIDLISRLATRTIGALAALSVAAAAVGSEIDVYVVDRDGHHVAGVAVYAVSVDGPDVPSSAATTAVMDQNDRRFIPHLLIVQTGTTVEFPNSDTVAHHVYSFSRPNAFTLPMYKGEEHRPITFEHAGIVSIGCNIHDNMLGYILILDSESFAKTDENGHASLSLSDSERYSINIWSPRIRDKKETLSRMLTVSDTQQSELVFSLAKKLKAPHRAGSNRSTWSDY